MNSSYKSLLYRWGDRCFGNLKALQGTVTRLLPCVGFRIEAQEGQVARIMLQPLLGHRQPGFWQVTSQTTKLLLSEKRRLRRLTSPMAQCVNNLPAVQETQDIRVQTLGREDPLGEEMATHCSFLSWRIPWAKEPGRLYLWGFKKSDMTEHACLHTHTHTHTHTYTCTKHSYSQLIQSFCIKSYISLTVLTYLCWHSISISLRYHSITEDEISVLTHVSSFCSTCTQLKGSFSKNILRSMPGSWLLFLSISLRPRSSKVWPAF